MFFVGTKLEIPRSSSIWYRVGRRPPRLKIPGGFSNWYTFKVQDVTNVEEAMAIRPQGLYEIDNSRGIFNLGGLHPTVYQIEHFLGIFNLVPRRNLNCFLVSQRSQPAQP